MQALTRKGRENLKNMAGIIVSSIISKGRRYAVPFLKLRSTLRIVKVEPLLLQESLGITRPH